MFIDSCGGVRAAFRATALLLCLQAAHAAYVTEGARPVRPVEHVGMPNPTIPAV